MARGYWILLVLLTIGIVIGWYGHAFYEQRFSPSSSRSTNMAASPILPDAYTLTKLETQARNALYQVFLTNPECLTGMNAPLKLQIDLNTDMDFPGLLDQLHRQAPNGLTIDQLRQLARCIGVDGAEALRVLLNPAVYAQWRSEAAVPR